MSFPQYKSYKDSGIGWLGQVPEDWEVKRLKFLGEFKGGAGFPHDKQGQTSGDLRFYKVGDLGQAGKDGYLQEPENRVDLETAKNLGAHTFGTNSIVFAKVGAALLLNRFRLLRHSSCLDNNMMGFQVTHSEAGLQYLWYSLGLLNMVEIVNPGAVPSINEGNVKECVTAFPPLLEQHAIATFLDRETARIDTLIAKQERLIALSVEKRRALISHAVTRGLGENVPLQDSGVEWLGQVPQSWQVKPLKRTVDFVEGPGILANDFVEAGVPLLRIAGLGSDTATLDGCNFLLPDLVESKWKHFRVKVGDLLISGSASTGLCSEVDSVTEGAIPYTGIIIVRPSPEIVSKNFIRWYFVSDQFETQVSLCKTGSTIQHFGPTHLARMFICLPSLAEQKLICTHLDMETAKIDTLITKAQRSIELMREHRTSLIAAAVTGKIDVRGIVPIEDAL